MSAYFQTGIGLTGDNVDVLCCIIAFARVGFDIVCGLDANVDLRDLGRHGLCVKHGVAVASSSDVTCKASTLGSCIDGFLVSKALVPAIWTPG